MDERKRQLRVRKRKAKRAKQARRKQPSEPHPYTGHKYQTDDWVPHVYQTELAIYEGIKLSQSRLTNKQVKDAIVYLITELRNGISPQLPDDEPEMPFATGREAEFLVWNIRRHWGVLFQEEGPTSRADLVGILRTLLHSIEAHAWNTGPQRGYVAFLKDFLGRGRGVPLDYFAS